MLCNQWLKWEIRNGGTVYSLLIPCWLLWAPTQWSGPLSFSIKNQLSRIHNQLTPQMAHNTEIRRWLKLTHKVCSRITKKKSATSHFALWNWLTRLLAVKLFTAQKVNTRLLASPLPFPRVFRTSEVRKRHREYNTIGNTIQYRWGKGVPLRPVAL